ncbi:MAG: hypothetical protein LBR08_09855 [Bacteroidales bacterium]|jgi:hypothetical protein|nr:hypothetical protein [Bacteroidales bacterium]
MIQGLFSVSEVSRMIDEGLRLILAGVKETLQQLPAGNWIAGATPCYVSSGEPNEFSENQLYVNQLPEYITQAEIKTYDADHLKNIFKEGPENGFTVLLLPFGSEALREYALHAFDYENFGLVPLFGWVAGEGTNWASSHADVVISGSDAKAHLNKAVVMHVGLPAGKYAEVHIHSPFKIRPDTAIVFDENTTHPTDVLINGEKRRLEEYMVSRNISFQYPLIANMAGINICVSFYYDVKPLTTMGTALFKGLTYYFSEPDTDMRIWEIPHDRIYALCCLYYVLEPDPERLCQMTGPATYGEIGYQVVSQSIVYLTIGDVE